MAPVDIFAPVGLRSVMPCDFERAGKRTASRADPSQTDGLQRKATGRAHAGRRAAFTQFLPGGDVEVHLASREISVAIDAKAGDLPELVFGTVSVSTGAAMIRRRSQRGFGGEQEGHRSGHAPKDRPPVHHEGIIKQISIFENGQCRLLAQPAPSARGAHAPPTGSPR